MEKRKIKDYYNKILISKDGEEYMILEDSTIKDKSDIKFKNGIIKKYRNNDIMDGRVTNKYKENKIVGKYFKSKYGNFKVIEKINKEKFIILFDNGEIVQTYKRTILNGNPKNKKSKTVYGIGYLDGEKCSHFLYQKWSNNIERCYYEKCKKYKDYGGKGIFMDERWHSLKNYVNDLILLPNYEEDKVKNGELVLDKDILCDELNINPKIYSPETCQWVTTYENQLQMLKTNKKESYENPNCKINIEDFIYIYTNPDNLTAKELSIKYNLHTKYISNSIWRNKVWISFIKKNDLKLNKIDGRKIKKNYFLAINKINGIILFINNINDFSKLYNFTKKNIYNCINNKRESYKDYIFKRVDLHE